ncbi:MULTISPECIES: hypothetical protein [unclassified Neisseria]|nr:MULTISPECIES: hypothetical protein [unclassified Neisseria]MBF0804739.1 hypothetical protein [Neisseria sp. 19428wB4_WF04]
MWFGAENKGIRDNNGIWAFSDGFKAGEKQWGLGKRFRPSENVFQTA